jgi:hypothetical protein
MKNIKTKREEEILNKLKSCEDISQGDAKFDREIMDELIKSIKKAIDLYESKKEARF